MKIVALDLMDTMLADPFREALAAALGPDWMQRLAGRPHGVWARFETAELTEDEFWQQTAGDDVDRDAFERVRVQRTVWLPGMRDLVADLRSADVPVVVGTNYPCWIDDLERRFLDGNVDAVVASCRIGARKPDPAFYDAVLAAASRVADGAVDPGDVLFVDDRQGNVDGAAAFGMQAVVFSGADGLRADLATRGLPV